MNIKDCLTAYERAKGHKKGWATSKAVRELLATDYGALEPGAITAIGITEIMAKLEAGACRRPQYGPPQSLGKYAQTTRHMRFAQLKAFLNFCWIYLGQKQIDPVIFKALAPDYQGGVPAARELPNSPAEVWAIIKSIKKPRYRLLWTLCFAGGLRIAEALNIRPEDIKEDGRIILRDTKTMQGDELPREIDPFVLSQVRALAETQGTPKDARIWPQTRKAAWDSLRRTGAKHGYPHLAPHDWKRLAITTRVMAGIPINVVSISVGHKNPATTWRYVERVAIQKAQLKIAASSTTKGFTD